MAYVSFLLLMVIFMWAIAEVVQLELDEAKKGRLIVVPAEPLLPRRRAAR
jgi:hypothetical protein